MSDESHDDSGDSNTEEYHFTASTKKKDEYFSSWWPFDNWRLRGAGK